QDILVALGCFLIWNLAQHTEAHELLQPIGQQVPGNSKRRLEFVEPSDAKKTLAQDEQAPAVTDHRHGAGQRARLLFEGIPFHRRLQRICSPVKINSKLELTEIQQDAPNPGRFPILNDEHHIDSSKIELYRCRYG